MGSDFHFSDLEINLRPTDTYTLIQEDSQYWKIETQSDEHPLYSKWIATISKDKLLPVEVDYFDKRGTLLKKLTVDDIQNIDGHEIPIKSTMQNIPKGTKTTLSITDIQINISDTEIPLEMFSAQYMENQ